jgi:protein involved in polysaccharide export with SLBB domain
MNVDNGWSSRREQTQRAARRGMGLILCLLTGCCLGRPHLDEALLADDGSVDRNHGVATAYLIACPDVLDVQVTGRPDVSGRYTVKADGRIELGRRRVRVEGLTTPDVAARLTDRVEAPAADVHVRVAEYNSQQVYLVGEVTGLQRAVPYMGPETVLDLLQRTGGIKPGAEPHEVHVIRARVAEGQAPQVFHIDLQAILLQKDERTNLRLQPFDQVYVGESPQACYARCVPPCFRAVYDALWGMYRNGEPVRGTE